LALSAQYAEQSLCNGTATVCPSVCPSTSRPVSTGMDDRLRAGIPSRYVTSLQCFDAVGWAAGRAPGL